MQSPAIPQDVLFVNVGGCIYQTTRTTLCLGGAYWNAVVEHLRPEEKELFIDRDGTHFRYILNFMRGSNVLPEDRTVIRELIVEAEYYAMPALKQNAQMRLAHVATVSCVE